MEILVVDSIQTELFTAKIPGKYFGWATQPKTFTIPGFPGVRMFYTDFKAIFDEVAL